MANKNVNSNKGLALMSIICIFAVLMVLITALLSITLSAYNRADSEERYQRSYMTVEALSQYMQGEIYNSGGDASSDIGKVLGQLYTSGGDPNLSVTKDNPVTGNVNSSKFNDLLGEAKVEFYWKNNSILVMLCTATTLGESRSLQTEFDIANPTPGGSNNLKQWFKYTLAARGNITYEIEGLENQDGSLKRYIANFQYGSPGKYIYHGDAGTTFSGDANGTGDNLDKQRFTNYLFPVSTSDQNTNASHPGIRILTKAQRIPKIIEVTDHITGVTTTQINPDAAIIKIDQNRGESVPTWKEYTVDETNKLTNFGGWPLVKPNMYIDFTSTVVAKKTVNLRTNATHPTKEADFDGDNITDEIYHQNDIYLESNLATGMHFNKTNIIVNEEVGPNLVTIFYIDCTDETSPDNRMKVTFDSSVITGQNDFGRELGHSIYIVSNEYLDIEISGDSALDAFMFVSNSNVTINYGEGIKKHNFSREIMINSNIYGGIVAENIHFKLSDADSTARTERVEITFFEPRQAISENLVMPGNKYGNYQYTEVG